MAKSKGLLLPFDNTIRCSTGTSSRHPHAVLEEFGRLDVPVAEQTEYLDRLGDPVGVVLDDEDA